MADNREMIEAIREGFKENARATKGGGFDTSGFTGQLGKLGEAFSPVTSVLGKAGSAISGLADVASSNITVWQQLSSSGANFNNDIIGMNVAAAGSRLSMQDFADVVKKNSANFIGLGGSVGQGAIAFANLGKEMFDSGVTDQLRTMGMSTKDINDALALQVGFQRSSFKDTKEGHAESIAAATKLATEMDSMSKLTGKTRAEQEDAMKKAMADMQVEAKFRLMEAEDRVNGTNKAEVARANYLEQYNQANARGQGQAFKEVFATGHIQSQEAANQNALLGKQATETAAAARALAAGDIEGAREHTKLAQAEEIKNQQNVNLMRLAVQGEAGGAAAKTSMDSMTASRGMYDAVAKIKTEGEWKNVTDAGKIREEAERRVANEQQGRDAKTGELIKGAASTDAMVKLQARVGDVNSAMMNGLVKPLNEQVGPALHNLATKYLGATVDRKTAGGKVETVGKAVAYEDTAKTAFNKSAAGAESGSKGKSANENLKGRTDEGYVGSGTIAAAAGLIGTATGAVVKAADKIDKAPKMANGGVVDTPTLAVIGDAGKEHVIPDLNLQSMVKNLKMDGMTTGITKITEQLGQMGSSMAPQQSAQSDQPVGGDTASLKDILESLNQLNKTMGSMASHTESISEMSGKQVRATKGLSNNRFAQG